jgi:hypothetical protein
MYIYAKAARESNLTFPAGQFVCTLIPPDFQEIIFTVIYLLVVIISNN